MQCLAEVAEEAGFENTRGELLCGPCYFALWGPRGAQQLTRSSEDRRPASRRPETIGPLWTPGPLGELDPEEPHRDRRGRRR